MAFLITKWFGCFLYDENNILVNSILFPHNKKKILEKLSLIKDHRILSEENEIIKDCNNIIVSEKRLRTLGKFIPNHPFFKSIIIDPNKYEYTQDFFSNITKDHAISNVKKLLEEPDHQIIQTVHAIDDLIQTSNLLMERITAWSIFPQSGASLDKLKNIQEKIDQEIINFQEIIKDKMNSLTPNMASLVGPMITAKLIAQAGSMQKLAMLPASSVQLLGAEKALFRFKKEGGKPPKHGIIYQHTYVCNAPRNLRGKISRLLALKISLAIKADVFTKRSIADDLENKLSEQINVLKKPVNV
jgi:nucleolar protein 56